jgi:hypothetical protein
MLSSGPIAYCIWTGYVRTSATGPDVWLLLVTSDPISPAHGLEVARGRPFEALARAQAMWAAGNKLTDDRRKRPVDGGCEGDKN